MGGLNTSSGTSSTFSPWSGPLGAFGKFETKTARPLISTLGSQYLEALRTGGVNSFIPWITRALDAVRSAGSQSMEQTREGLARTGMGGTSAGAEITANQQTGVNAETAKTPSEMIMEFIKGAPSFAMNLANSGSSAMGGAMSGNTSTTTTQTPSFWDRFMQGVQGGSSAVAAFNPPSTTMNFGTV